MSCYRSYYSATPITGNPDDPINKNVQMSWIAIGLYVFLRNSQSPITAKQISEAAYGIHGNAISLALSELIDQGLVTEQFFEVIEAEVVEEVRG